MASISTEYEENGGSPSPCGKLRVLFLASEWGSSKGGLSTMNRELAINIAQHSGVDVSFFVPRCNDEDRKAALGHKIELVEATRHPGMEELQWLSFLPDDLHVDVVVGHGIKLGPQASAIKKAQKCKWIQVVHTVPEELGMYKTYTNPLAGAEKKHKIEVELCQLADFVVSIGPKLEETFRCYLSSCKTAEMFFNFTPGIFSEFSEVKQVSEREGKFRVLLFGRGDEEDFSVKGFDVAAKAVASLENIKLVFVGALEGALEDVKNRFLKCGIHASNLTVRSFSPDRKHLERLFCEVDLAVMPSRAEGFGLTALEALSAGLPILVSENSGFGEALSKVRFGSYFVVDSDDAQVWANAIKRLQVKERSDRLEESEILRSLYAKRYDWKKQCGELISKMTALVEACSSRQSQRVSYQETQQRNVSSGRHPGTLPVLINLENATFQDNHSGDLTCLMKEMAMQFFDTMAAGIPNEEKPKCLYYYLEGVRHLKVKQAFEGSLRITVECPTLEILDQLWEDYSSGNLNAVVEEYLLTDDIKRRFHVEYVRLNTTILDEDYLACKRFLTDYSEYDQEPLAKERGNLLQDYFQVASETHCQSVVDSEPLTLHFSVNGKGQFPNMQQESAQDMDGKQQTFAEELANKEEVSRSLQEFPAYLQNISLIQDSGPTEENANSLRVAVECENTEILEQLWLDYRSGHLNIVAEKCLLTDDIKRRFHLTSVKLRTTILEEDYLACKNFLLINTESNQSLAEKQLLSPPSSQAADETRKKEKAQVQPGQESGIRLINSLIQSSERETRTQTLQNVHAYVADEKSNAVGDTAFQSIERKTSTMTNDKSPVSSSRTQPADENMFQVANETRWDYVSTEAFEETQNKSADGKRTQHIDENQSQSAEEQNIQDVGEIQNQTDEGQRTQAIDETHNQSSEGQNTQNVGKIQNQSAERQIILFDQGQYAEGQRSPAGEGDHKECLEEVRTQVSKESSKESGPWHPDVNETWNDFAVCIPLYTESTSKDYKDTGRHLRPNVFYEAMSPAPHSVKAKSQHKDDLEELVKRKVLVPPVDKDVPFREFVRKIGSTAQGENRELRLYDVALSGRSDVGQTSIFRRFRGDDFLSDTTTFSHWPDDTIKVKDRRVTVETSNKVSTYKVVLCGKTGVGKTSIFRRMCGSDLDSPQKGCARNTLDPVECNVSVELEKETKTELNLWDTAGLEQHATLTRSHYLLSQAVLIVYSVNDEESLSQAIEILKFAKIHAQGACFILITNKIDLEPTFTEDKLRSSIPKNAFVLQFRTSALTGEGIQDMLHKLASHLNKRATPMKPTGRSCLGNCNDKSASHNLDAGVVRLQFEDTHQRRRRRRKCCCS